MTAAVVDPAHLPDDPDETGDASAGGQVVAIRPDVTLHRGPWSDPDGTIHIPTPVAGLILTFTPDQKTLTEAQMSVLGPLGIEADWDPAAVKLFLVAALAQGFNPWLNEIYLFRYRDPFGGARYVRHVSIHTMRARCEQTGEYRGQLPPQFAGEDGVWRDVWTDRNRAPLACRVGVMREANDQIIYGVVYYDEVAPTEPIYGTGPDGKERIEIGRKPVKMWLPGAQGGKACLMLAKVAEALALRQAFPQILSGVFTPEELARQAEEDRAARAAEAAERARKRREEAMLAAQQAAAAPPPATAPAAAAEDPLPDAPAEVDRKALLLDELTAQALVMSVARETLAHRQLSLHGVDEVDQLSEEQLAELVQTVRPAVVNRLRVAGLHEEADAYSTVTAPNTVQLLFGRSLEELTELLNAAEGAGQA
jgi:phage recombination protein Bet